MNKLLNKLFKENIPIVFDYDGVLFEARWYEDRINMRNETEEKLIQAMKNGKNLETQPILHLTEMLKNIKGELFVLSYMHNDIEYNFKKKQIDKYFPMIRQENILKADSIEDKIKYLEDIREKYGKFVYIDDNHAALIMYENHFDDECKFFHVSSLYV